MHLTLPSGHTVLIDLRTFEDIRDYNWRLTKEGFVKCYARGKEFYLHRFITRPARNQHVIFLNHNKLDCRRINLAVVSRRISMIHNSKGGIRFDKKLQKYRAYVGEKYVGVFLDRTDAENARRDRIAHMIKQAA